MSAIEAVIFDLGNVLVLHDNPLMYRRLGERVGLSGEEVGRIIASPAVSEGTNRGRWDAEGIHRELCAIFKCQVPADEFAALWSCHFTLNEPVLSLVEGLAGKVKLVLLSNTNALHTAYLRPRLPLLERFDHLLFSNEVRMVKPEPEFYHAALIRAGVAPAAAAFFDDHPPFVEAARALGVHGHVYREPEEFLGHLKALGLA
jgi:glucose-1-phosphatase